MVKKEELKEGEYLFCDKDILNGTTLAFKKGHVYKVSDNNYIEGCNKSYWPFKKEWEEFFFKNTEQKGNTIKELKEDMVNHPKHYTWLKDLCNIEVIDITRYMDFDLGNAIKYILRCGHKSDAVMTDKEKEIEDLKKAIFYINDKIKMIEKNAI